LNTVVWLSGGSGSRTTIKFNWRELSRWCVSSFVAWVRGCWCLLIRGSSRSHSLP
jgi:hypothetical protein